jgi:multidrug transporter EmrE-like cation transporter
MMRKAILLGFLLLLALDTTSNVLAKFASNRIGSFEAELQWLEGVGREPIVLAIIACYIGAFLTYTSILKHAPVGPAFAAVHGHVVTVLMFSIWWFGERLTLLQVLGSLLVVAGIIVLGVTERMEAAPPSAARSDAPKKADATG